MKSNNTNVSEADDKPSLFSFSDSAKAEKMNNGLVNLYPKQDFKPCVCGDNWVKR